eukprot:TRINITY_DN33198_c0_g1_i1.p1 TRINITY_DN33198_c0_g1~~TRINITY_DN33198_c0_g1_i1.p1  ORF type:complete len:616 (-),score=52.98 TRINITY_DN33198_c0_g1_i1:135-1982(-)
MGVVVVGVRLFRHYVRFASFLLVSTPFSRGSDIEAEVADVERPNQIDWYSLGFDFASQSLSIDVPLEFLPLEGATLALTLREFRGSQQEYFTAIFAIAHALCSVVGATANGTFLFPDEYTHLGPLKMFNPEVNVNLRPIHGPPPCGTDGWPKHVTRGIELVLKGPNELLFGWRKKFVGTQKCFTGVACPRTMQTHLRWTVKTKAAQEAAAVLSRGSECSAHVSELLPELASASLLPTSPVNWTEVSAKVRLCTEWYRGAFWEVRVNASDWPEVLGKSAGSNAVSLPFQTLGRGRHGRGEIEVDLLVFVCAPSIELFPKGWQGIGATPSCTRSTVVGKVMPLLLGYMTDSLETMAVFPPRRARATMRGGPHWQPAVYHKRAVEQRRTSGKCGDPNQIRLSVAVCIMGAARTFSLPEVYMSMKSAITSLNSDTSIFYAIDFQDRSLAAFVESFQHLPPAGIAFVSGGDSWGEPSPCNHSLGSCGIQVHKMKVCLRLALAAEDQRGRPFDWFLRFRTDLFWFGPIGDLTCFDRTKVHMSHLMNGADPSDLFAMVPRQFVEGFFGGGCPSEAETSFCLCPTCCECLFANLVRRLGAQIAPFPPMYKIVRFEGEKGSWEE